MDTSRPEAPHSHLPFGADGSGYYSDNTKGCYFVIQEAIPLIQQAIESLSITDPKSTFNIADYGTADGGTSMPLISSCIQTLRSKFGEDLPIHVIYEDQPTNDFKSLFLRVNGLIPGSDALFEKFSNIYITACGTSFYKQCLPPLCVDLGFSATSMHWLSKKPCDITGGLHHTMIKDENEAKLFKEQAAKDWQTILVNRAKEIKPGGFLVLVQFTIDDDGQYLGHTKEIKNCMFTNMKEIWQEMMQEGRLNMEEYQRTTFINYYRTVAEYSAPFVNEDSPVRKAGLKLCSIETKVVRCPYNQRWREQGGDPQKHAEWFVPTTRTWSNHTFFSALSCNRSEEERREIVDDLFKRYSKRVAEAPADHGMDYVHAYIVIRKE
ncbi:uncharacterized protein LOC135686513 isoform X2 [Rhopilema esculentum]|uniref:uncharacterized protein LOC135686513 isoform X2 n=1 Tax=Rhopilema esculentum TaxID=499914 RepID=UPI0031DB50A1